MATVWSKCGKIKMCNFSKLFDSEENRVEQIKNVK